MTNGDFQKLVLEQLSILNKGQQNLEEGQRKLELKMDADVVDPLRVLVETISAPARGCQRLALWYRRTRQR